ncbi:hypothetical protein BDV32DRAFT_123196 [Aspergillus pseudonomiae]|uniref:Uncharacterized protein n=1 Tax=Aspergillus pseudonomiae TaxID=1506151 RepID=A0A5N7D6W7_9EURO|nr:uncharacterized protein BDV37DRAFT_252999 [Aspergillus pseudonomiae]KAB8260378.1 hypothetical protein BDV32DRAFT_123196 [Aspergillus pseudonomiae]KAE8402172.1 hypothetical protein BDV37DRAFT_252999 [Aspergillus pseudonomiae]
MASWHPSPISSTVRARRISGIEMATPMPNVYSATYERGSCSDPSALWGNSSRFIVKKVAMNDRGRKTVVTIVNTIRILPWRVVPAAWSRANRASKAFACFCFRSSKSVMDEYIRSACLSIRSMSLRCMSIARCCSLNRLLISYCDRCST